MWVMVATLMQMYNSIDIENGQTWTSKNSGSGRDQEAKNLKLHEQYQIECNQTLQITKQQTQIAIK